MENIMNSCPNCGGKIVHKTVESDAFWGKYKIKVSGIEADVCENCNEQFMSIEDSIMLEKLADSLSSSDNKIIGDADSILNLSETASLLRVSQQSVYNMIRDGRIKARKIGREWRFFRAEIMSMLSDSSEQMLAARNGKTRSENDEKIIEKYKNNGEQDV